MWGLANSNLIIPWTRKSPRIKKTPCFKCWILAGWRLSIVTVSFTRICTDLSLQGGQVLQAPRWKWLSQVQYPIKPQSWKRFYYYLKLIASRLFSTRDTRQGDVCNNLYPIWTSILASCSAAVHNYFIKIKQENELETVETTTKGAYCSYRVPFTDHLITNCSVSTWEMRLKQFPCDDQVSGTTVYWYCFPPCEGWLLRALEKEHIYIR